jgi:signal transduction histidine kinase
MAMTPITPAVRTLIHELATPLTVLMSASDILHHRVPGAIAELVDQLRDISHQFGQEVIELRASLNERIDLQSSISAASQIRQWAAEWRQGYAARLAPLADQIQGAAVHLPEPLLERILNQSLPNGLDELGRVLSRLEALQPEDLETS